MRRLLCLASVALLMVGCGNNKRSNDANSEEVAVPTVLPHELTANKDAAFAKKKNIHRNILYFFNVFFLPSYLTYFS